MTRNRGGGHEARNLLWAFVLPFVVEAAMVTTGIRGITVVLVPPVVVGFFFLVRALGPWAAAVGIVYVPLMWWLLIRFAIVVGTRLYGGDSL